MYYAIDGEIPAATAAHHVHRKGAAVAAPPGIDPAEWRHLADNALEPNAFMAAEHYLPLAFHTAQARASRVLVSRGAIGIDGILPLTSAWRAFRLPVPAMVLAQPYMPLGTPLIGRGDPVRAAGNLIDAARETGVALIGLGAMTADGPVARAFTAALAERGLAPIIRNAHQRAALVTGGDAEAYLRGGLGTKKLKELRRQRHRLEDLGRVDFRVVRAPAETEAALSRFLALEAGGWKGREGTALGASAADAAYITGACKAFAANGRLEIGELLLDGTPVASGLVFRSQDAAFFFKTAYDEAHLRASPGVQLTVELTRHLLADPTLARADSVAIADHPMIDHVWRERIDVCDFFIPTRRGATADLSMAAFDARYRARAAAKSVLSTIRTGRKPA